MQTLKYVAGAVIVMLLAVNGGAQGPQGITADADLEAARQVRDYYADWLSSIPGVSAVRAANNQRGEPEIVVDVSQRTPQIKQIPDKLNGIPVVVESLPQAEGEQLYSQPANIRGYLPTPTPEAEIKPVPTPAGNTGWQ